MSFIDPRYPSVYTESDVIQRDLTDGMEIHLDWRYSREITKGLNHHPLDSNGKPCHVPVKSMAAMVLIKLLSHDIEEFSVKENWAKLQNGSRIMLYSLSQFPDMWQCLRYKSKHRGRIQCATWNFPDSSTLYYSWEIRTGHSFSCRRG